MDPILYGLDIETDTAAGGLDPSRAAIVAIALAGPDGDEVYDGDEATLLRQVDARLEALTPGVIVTWNGGAFDLPFIADRAGQRGVELGLTIRHDPRMASRDPLPGHPGTYRGHWYGHGHLDGYRLYRADVGRTLGLSCGLKPMARMAGLGPVEVDITELHLLSREEVAAYVASDARMARALVTRRLPHALASID